MVTLEHLQKALHSSIFVTIASSNQKIHLQQPRRWLANLIFCYSTSPGKTRHCSVASTSSLDVLNLLVVYQHSAVFDRQCLKHGDCFCGFDYAADFAHHADPVLRNGDSARKFVDHLVFHIQSLSLP